MEFKSQIRTEAVEEPRRDEDLASQLDLYAVSLMERTGGYGPSGMGSTPVLRASEV